MEHLDHLPHHRVGVAYGCDGWFVYGRKPISESEIKREIERQARPRTDA